MSRQHPIIAVTGSSGAGTTQVKTAFERICTKERLKPAIIEGDSYHRFDRAQMEAAVAEAAARGEQITHFGPAGNLFDELEETFRRYGENGTGRVRRYVHTEAEAEETGCPPGTFTPWEELPPDTDLLLYEGLNVSQETLRNVPAEVLYFKNKPVLKDVMAAVERVAV